MEGSDSPKERWLDRRAFLGEMGTGSRSVAPAWHLSREARAPEPPRAPKAKRVLRILCPGAVSSMDTFDYKPELQARHGLAALGRALFNANEFLHY
jgi:hypothetical protein